MIEPGDTPLKERQLLTEEEHRNYRLKYGERFTSGMGAEAVRELLGRLDLEPKTAGDIFGGRAVGPTAKRTGFRPLPDTAEHGVQPGGVGPGLLQRGHLVPAVAGVRDVRLIPRAARSATGVLPLEFGR